MNHRLTPKYLIAALICILPCFYASGGINKENRALLERLDSILDNHDTLVKEKEIRIEGLRNSLATTRSESRKLELCGQLYDEYLVFNSDSALYYAGKAKKIVEKSMPDNYDLIADWKLNEAFLFTVQGLYDMTMNLLDGIESNRLSREMKSKYYESMEYIHSMRKVYLKAETDLWKENVSKATQYRDSINAQGLKTSPMWAWVPVAVAVEDKNKQPQAADVETLKRIVDGAKGYSRENAINSYWLSRYYENQGNDDLMLKYKINASINDAMIVNRELAAIQEIAVYLFSHNDLNRAYNYLNYAVEQANLYRNRNRIVNLSDEIATVRDAYRMEVERHDRRLRALAIALGVLSIVLLGCVCFILMEFSKLKKMRNLLKNTNVSLTASVAERDRAIAELEKSNAELNATNQQKIGLIAYAFKLTTVYIGALEEYRKKLLKKYKVKRIDDLGVLINDPELINELYQGFYEGFDKTVLSIFPDFVEEYNKTVGESSQVSAEAIGKSKTLNTKLRIYALRRLGISKSAEIAEMLNVSIRTVYNNRNKTASED